MKRTNKVLLMTLVVACAGCALVSGKSDYTDYRTVRLAEQDDQRQDAMRDYLAAHPDGSWSEEIRAERANDEPTIYEASKSTRAGLSRYIELYPEGTYTAQAQQRLAALSSVQENREGEQEAAREVLSDRRENVLESRRLWGSRAVGYWSKILLSVNNWGSPIADVARSNPDFSQAFASDPRPRCSQEECIKFYQIDFAIPVPGRTRIDRTLRMFLRLRLTDGNLTRAEMLLPNRGFSRWYELENREFVTDEDPQVRQAAIEWALGKIIPIMRETATNARGIDVVPEPIDPPTVRAPNQPDRGAGNVPGVEAAEETAPTEQAEQAAPEEAAPEENSGEIVLPIALQGLQAGDIRVVVFAAGEDDEGAAYDGVFLELAPPEPAPEAK